MNKFAQALMRDRETLGLTQGQLAEAIGISQQAIARWEGGQSFPRTSTYNKLVNHLQIRCEQMGKQSLTKDTPTPMPGLLSDKLQEFLESQNEGSGPKASPERLEAITDFLDNVNKLKAETNLNIEHPLIDNDIWHFIKELVAIPELKGRVTKAFGSNPTDATVRAWINQNQAKDIKTWIDESRELLVKHYGFKRSVIDANLFEKENAPDRISQGIRDNIHAAFWKNIGVMVQRGINSKQYDYFSNNVVAEFKMLHPFRPPSFNINQYAPAVVSLMLAKTMSFGQNKTYFLFLLHNKQIEEDVIAVRMQSLQLDCSSLGIHVLMVKNIKQAAMSIQLAEEMAEGTLNIRNSVRKP
jgi:transcriptional regulator with XRE-family HTH domain